MEVFGENRMLNTFTKQDLCSSEMSKFIWRIGLDYWHLNKRLYRLEKTVYFSSY